MTARLVHIAVAGALAVTLGGCTGAALVPAVATPTPVVIVATPAPSPSPEPTKVDVYAGKVLFGSKVTNDLAIPNQKATFDRKAKEIAWVGHLSEPAGTDKLAWQVFRVTGGSEKLMWTEKTAVSPDWTLVSSHSGIPKFLGNKAGKYVMRYSRGGRVLAEGTFTLK